MSLLAGSVLEWGAINSNTGTTESSSVESGSDGGGGMYRAWAKTTETPISKHEWSRFATAAICSAGLPSDMPHSGLKGRFLQP